MLFRSSGLYCIWTLQRICHYRESVYTEEEFLTLITKIYNAEGSEKEINQLVVSFSLMVQHPEGNGLIFYPPDDREDSPMGVIKELKRWYKEQNLSLFKE